MSASPLSLFLSPLGLDSDIDYSFSLDSVPNPLFKSEKPTHQEISSQPSRNMNWSFDTATDTSPPSGLYSIPDRDFSHQTLSSKVKSEDKGNLNFTPAENGSHSNLALFPSFYRSIPPQNSNEIISLIDSEEDEDEEEARQRYLKQAQYRLEKMQKNRKLVLAEQAEQEALDFDLEIFKEFTRLTTPTEEFLSVFPQIFCSIENLKIMESFEERLDQKVVEQIREQYMRDFHPHELVSLNQLWYPSQLDHNSLLSDAFNIEITPRILSVLRSGWLTDHIIDFYANLISIRGSPHFISSSPGEIRSKSMVVPHHWPKSNLLHAERKGPCSFCWNSFFYTTLSRKHSGFNFKSVSRWTISKKVDVTVVDFMMFPIHLGNHWTLATVDMNNETWHYFDSLGGKRHDVISNLKRWLKAEIIDKFGESFLYGNKRWITPIESWKEIYHGRNSPQQHNGSDCGVFTMVTAKLFGDGITNISHLHPLTQSHIPHIRKRMTLEIFTGKLI